MRQGDESCTEKRRRARPLPEPAAVVLLCCDYLFLILGEDNEQRSRLSFASRQPASERSNETTMMDSAENKGAGLSGHSRHSYARACAFLYD